MSDIVDVSFKKRKKRGRSRARLCADVVAKAANDESDKVAEMLALQRARARRPGLAHSTLEPDAESFQLKEASSVVEIADESSDSKRLKKLGSAFQQKKQENFSDLYMEQYIEEKLKSKGRSVDVSDTDQNDVDAKNEDDQVQVSSHKKSEDSGERWLTGIMEIPTSIDERLKNVEQTELATQKLLKEKQMRSQESVSILPSNLSANFKSNEKRTSASRGMASDEKALAAFKKRQFRYN